MGQGLRTERLPLLRRAKARILRVMSRLKAALCSIAVVAAVLLFATLAFIPQSGQQQTAPVPHQLPHSVARDSTVENFAPGSGHLVTVGLQDAIPDFAQENSGINVMPAVVQLDANNFKSVVTSEGLVLVEFMSPLCSVCKTAQADVEELALTTPVPVTVAQIHARRFSELAELHRAIVMPTFVLFKDGQEVYRRTGGGATLKFDLPIAIYEHSDLAPQDTTPPARPTINWQHFWWQVCGILWRLVFRWGLLR